MSILELSPEVETVSRNAEGSFGEFLEQIYKRTRNSVSSSFNEGSMLLREQEERDQLDLIKKGLHSKVVELGHLYAFASVNGASTFELSHFLEDDDGILSFDELDKDTQSFVILLAFYCAYVYGEIDGRNWTGNGDNIAHLVPDDLNPADYKGLIEDGLQVNSIIDAASEKFLERNREREIEKLWINFLSFSTSPLPQNRDWKFQPEFLDREDLQSDSPHLKDKLEPQLVQLWEVFTRDYIDWDYLRENEQ